MKLVHPHIVDVSSTDWDGASLVTARAVMFGIHIEIGDKGSNGADLFQMCVCNPAYIGENPGYLNEVKNPRQGPWRGQMLVIDELCFKNIRNAVEYLIDLHEGYSSWPEFAASLDDHLDWEFKGMPYPPFP